uniref:uncharacterized protein LOC101293908 isoform X1 n=2 Tax=Fragaria vesca subsp. vesca TaxID=101020 RepID=UPI0005C8B31B|nr:PREDICTED: uncharacterized protein LOC101293908 isoform X1 [Fragaria vesca subsp. vesca]
MGFLGGILRKYGSNSIVGNLKPGLNFSTTRGSLGICLEDIKQRGTSEQKKVCMRKILEAMTSRMGQGYLGGCMDPTKIPIIENGLDLPHEPYVEGKYPSYLSSVENLAVYLHENDQLSTRDKMKFDDFKKYSRLLSNTRHLALLAGHPHLQATWEERDYITAALHQLSSITSADPFFPLPPTGCHQVPLALAFTCPRELKFTWIGAYKRVCITRKIDIFATIEHAGKEFVNNYEYSEEDDKPYSYTNNDAIDELFYYSNFTKHYCVDGDTKLLDTLHDKFPFNTREMFKFHSTYDKHAMGKVDLERLMGIMNRYNTLFSTFL